MTDNEMVVKVLRLLIAAVAAIALAGIAAGEINGNDPARNPAKCPAGVEVREVNQNPTEIICNDGTVVRP